MRTRLLVAVSTLAIMAGMLAAPSSAAAPPGGGGRKTTTTGATTTTLAPTTTTAAPTTTTSGTGTFNALCQNVAYVDSANPTSNFGSVPDMLVSGTSRLSHVGCAVAGIPTGSVATAQLRVFSRSVNTPHTLRLHPQPAVFSEATVTWNTLNSYDPVVLDSQPGDLVAGAGEWVQLAAGPVSDGEARFSLETATVGGSGLFAYASDDYTTDISRRPYLAVSYSPAPTTTTAGPTTTTEVPTTTVAPTTTTTPPGDPQPLGPPGSYALIFQDEFDGTSLDTTKWVAEEGRNANNVITRAANVTVHDGAMHHQLTQPGGTGTQVYGTFAETDMCFGTSNCPTPGRFNLYPGQVTEARVMFPGGCPTGATSCAEDIWDWPAYWTTGHNWPEDGEYDVFEGLGGDASINYHSCQDTTPTDGCADVANNGHPTPACCYGNEWHTVTLVRGVTSSQVWWDGVLQRTIPVGDNGLGHSLVVALGKSNSRPVHLGVEGEIQVDYVRAWSPA